MTSPSLTLKMILLGTDQTASAALSSLASNASSLPAKLAGPLSKMGSLIGGEVGELVEKMSTGLERLGEEGTGIGTKFAAGGAALAGIGAAGALIGSKDKASLEQLKTAITDSGSAYSDYQEDIEKTIKKQENFGNSATATQNALQTLTSATQDPKKAIDEMGVTADLAAAKHISLGDAATLMAKILNGSGAKTLKQYGITTKDMNEATTQLADKLKGQASASVDSWGGKLDVLKTKIGDQVAILGQRFGPALTVAGTGIAAMGTVMQVLAARQALAATATEAETLATTEQAGASKIAAAAQWLFNAAMDANPLVLLGIAIAAVVAGIIYLALKTQFFQDVWKAVWNAITAAFSAVVSFLTTAFHDVVSFMITWGPVALVALAPFIGIPLLIYQHFGQIVGWLRGVWSTVWNDVTGFVSNVVHAIEGIPAAIGGLAGQMADAGKNLLDSLWNGFLAAARSVGGALADLGETIWNGVKGFINDGLDRIRNFQVGAFGIDVKPFEWLPHLASGGVVTSPTVAMIGEAGPEAVIPLNRFSGGSLGGSGQPVDVTVTVMLDSQVIGAGLARMSNSGQPLSLKIAGVNA